MELSTPSFVNGRIPKDFTCDGADRSPELTWTQPPAGTRTLALLVTDPDAPAGTWVHWVLYNVPSGMRGLAAAVPRQDRLADGSHQGRNDFGRIGYGGPCPPGRSVHRYVFELFALDTALQLPPGTTRNQLERAMEGHILAHAELLGRYGR